EHHVTEQEAMEEQMFLGLRKNEGVARQSFQDKFNRTLEEVYGEQLNELIESGLITRVDDYYRLTKAGLFRGNDVFEKFLF
ncbi:MAG TPA: coproporphyrinogen III oxidase, partial [Savagea sp.]